MIELKRQRSSVFHQIKGTIFLLEILLVRAQKCQCCPGRISSQPKEQGSFSVRKAALSAKGFLKKFLEPVLYPKVSSTFSKVAGSRGGAPDALRTASRSEAFRAQPAEGGLLARDERGTLYPEKRIFRVNCRKAARGGFLQVKKPPCRKKHQTGFYRSRRMTDW